MIEIQVGKVKTGHITGGFTVIIPKNNLSHNLKLRFLIQWDNASFQYSCALDRI